MKTKTLAVLGFILIVVSIISCGTKSPTVAITPSIRPTQTIAPAALTFLNNALDLIQEYSYYRKNVDWSALRLASYQLASGAITPAQTYAAINLVFYTLGDTHGGINRPYIPVSTDMPTPIPNFLPSVGKLLEDRLGYILVPSSGFDDTNVANGYVASMQGEIRRIDQSHPCGWIVDLRGNAGGWYSPMEVGIGPILGEGQLGGSVDSDGNITYFTYLDGIARWGNEIEFEFGSPYHLLESNPPVAVLTDGGTDSAAEALAIVFRGRPDTRSFGQPTGGHNPGTGKVITLDDGGILWITTALAVDRTGKIYPEAPIQPEEVVPLPNDGSVPQVAEDWLLSNPACNQTHIITPSP
jgi:carboxyl-terminal processing protease